MNGEGHVLLREVLRKNSLGLLDQRSFGIPSIFQKDSGNLVANGQWMESVVVIGGRIVAEKRV